MVTQSLSGLLRVRLTVGTDLMEQRQRRMLMDEQLRHPTTLPVRILRGRVPHLRPHERPVHRRGNLGQVGGKPADLYASIAIRHNPGQPGLDHRGHSRREVHEGPIATLVPAGMASRQSQAIRNIIGDRGAK